MSSQPQRPQASAQEPFVRPVIPRHGAMVLLSREAIEALLRSHGNETAHTCAKAELARSLRGDPSVPDWMVTAARERLEAFNASLTDDLLREAIRAILGRPVAPLDEPSENPIGLGDEERGELRQIAHGLETGFFQDSSLGVISYATKAADLLHRVLGWG